MVLDGHEVKVQGHISPPFGIFRETDRGPAYRGIKRHTLVHLPTRRIIATLRSHRQCRALAAELAPIFARDEHGGTATVERHISEQA